MNNPIKWVLGVTDPSGKYAQSKYVFSTGDSVMASDNKEMRMLKTGLLPAGAYDPATLAPANLPDHIIEIFNHRIEAFATRALPHTEMVNFDKFEVLNKINVGYVTDSGLEFTFKLKDVATLREMGETIMMSYAGGISEFEPPVFSNGFATLVLMPCLKDRGA